LPVTPTSTRPATAEGDKAPRGARGSQIFDLDPPRPKRKARLPEIALGVLLIAGFGLAALWFQLASNQTTPVIALAGDVSRGDIIELTDLQLVFIETEDELNVLGEHESGVVVGRVALANMTAGTLITAEDVTSGAVIDAGQGVVGLELSAGEYPSLAMRAGDVVDVVLTPVASEVGALDGGRDAILARTRDQVLVERAVGVEVAPVGTQGQVFASLVMSESEAALVSQAAALDRVRLIEVSDDAPPSGETEEAAPEGEEPDDGEEAGDSEEGDETGDASP
jgi:hypothetical protein